MFHTIKSYTAAESAKNNFGKKKIPTQLKNNVTIVCLLCCWPLQYFISEFD